MPLSRRSILTSAVGAPFAALLAPSVADAERATRRIGDHRRFTPLVGERFLLRAEDQLEPLLATLIAVDRDPPTAVDQPGCFVLRFDLITDSRADQAIYTIAHPTLEPFTALAAPSSIGGRSLAVVFNNPG